MHASPYGQKAISQLLFKIQGDGLRLSHKKLCRLSSERWQVSTIAHLDIETRTHVVYRVEKTHNHPYWIGLFLWQHGDNHCQPDNTKPNREYRVFRILAWIEIACRDE